MNDIVWDVPKERQFYMFTYWTCKPLCKPCKPHFRFNGKCLLGDQDWLTLLSWRIDDIFFKLPCAFNYVVTMVNKHSAFYTTRCQTMVPLPTQYVQKCEYHITYGSISPGRGKWPKYGIFFYFFWISAVTKQFDFFNFSTVLKRFCPLDSMFSFWS